MKKLGLAVALLSLTQIACIIQTTNDQGVFDVAWNITQGGIDVGLCSDVGVAAVETVSTDQLSANFMAYSDIFRGCDAWVGFTDPLPFSDYTVTWALLDSTDQRVTAITEPAPVDRVLQVDVLVLPLATFDFAAATATVTFDVDFGVSGGNNCGGGEQVIAQETIFTVSPGGGQCTDYVLSFNGSSSGCADGTCDLCPLNDAPCAETNVLQIISGLPDGDYTLQVHGVCNCAGNQQLVQYSGDRLFTIINSVNIDIGTVVSTGPGCSGC